MPFFVDNVGKRRLTVSTGTQILGVSAGPCCCGGFDCACDILYIMNFFDAMFNNDPECPLCTGNILNLVPFAGTFSSDGTVDCKWKASLQNYTLQPLTRCGNYALTGNQPAAYSGITYNSTTGIFSGILYCQDSSAVNHVLWSGESSAFPSSFPVTISRLSGTTGGCSPLSQIQICCTPNGFTGDPPPLATGATIVITGTPDPLAPPVLTAGTYHIDAGAVYTGQYTIKDSGGVAIGVLSRDIGAPGYAAWQILPSVSGEFTQFGIASKCYATDDPPDDGPYNIYAWYCAGMSCVVTF